MRIRLFTYALGLMAVVGSVAPAMSRSNIPIVILPDGSFQIEGHHYTTQAAVAAELKELNKRQPHPEFHVLLADKRMPYGVVMTAIASLQSTGEVKLGAVNTAPK
jgi:biopolymer transport protein ExbD